MTTRNYRSCDILIFCDKNHAVDVEGALIEGMKMANYKLSRSFNPSSVNGGDVFIRLEFKQLSCEDFVINEFSHENSAIVED